MADYLIVYVMMDHMINTELSLWITSFTEEARRQVCVQNSTRFCFVTRLHNVFEGALASFKDVFNLLNLKFAADDPDGSVLRYGMHR